MVSANVLAPQVSQPVAEAVAIRPSVRLPAWLEVAKPRLIPLLLATTPLSVRVLAVRHGVQRQRAQGGGGRRE